MKNRLAVKTIRDLGPQFTDNDYRMVGQDGAYSIPLKNETLWFFGDTLIGERAPGDSLWYVKENSIEPQALVEGWNKIDKIIHNTAALVPEQSAENGISDFNHIRRANGSLKQLIGLLPNENHDFDRIWCFHGLNTADYLYLYYQKIKMIEDENNPFPVAFEVIGSGLSKGDTDSWAFERLLYNGSTIIWPANRPQFGAVVLRDADYLYLYGVLRDNTAGVQNVYVARVLCSSIEDFAIYEYLVDCTQARWSTDIEQACIVFTGPPNELSVSFNRHLDSYLAVHSQDVSGIIVGRTAPNPWGPWFEPVVLHTVTLPKKKIPYPVLVYAGKEHPELAQDGGRKIYVTYIEFEEYFPHLLEIELT
ncbi:MAG: DUF4185 domain-containing protein [Candidatus Marinimicrobia bacterium]|nr:DUF4185 domain-containing protein [Candidatus Neomarinimicrobiota bacterium]